MTPPFALSPATVADVEEIADLAARTFPLACPPELPDEVIAEFVARHLGTESFRGYLSAPGHRVICARAARAGAPAGAVIGYALLVDGTAMDPSCDGQIEHRPTVGLSKLYVDPAHHGSGLASALLTEVERAAAAAGARSVWLGTNVANTRARRFYERSGFAERGGRTFVVGGVSNTDVVYEKTLAPRAD